MPHHSLQKALSLKNAMKLWSTANTEIFRRFVNLILQLQRYNEDSKLFACWVIFSNICFQNFQKIHCFHPYFLLIYNLNVKQFGSRMKPHILWGFIWIQIVCKGHQRSSKFTASGLRVNP